LGTDNFINVNGTIEKIPHRSKFNLTQIVFFSPETKYDIGFSPSCKVSERQAFIISNTLIFSTFVTTQYSNIRTRLE
ncbi:hypothetical protein L9F63_011407, partial [Diploptera punctata]